MPESMLLHTKEIASVTSSHMHMQLGSCDKNSKFLSISCWGLIRVFCLREEIWRKRGREGIQGCIGSCQVAKRPPWQLYGSLYCSPCKLPGPWGYLLFLYVSTHTFASSLPADGWCQATSVLHLHIPYRRRCMQQPFNQFQTNFYEQEEQCSPYSSHKWEIPHLFSEEKLGYFSARIDKSQTNGRIACEHMCHNRAHGHNQINVSASLKVLSQNC